MSKLKDIIKSFSPNEAIKGSIGTIIEKGADVVDRFVTTNEEKQAIKQEWAKILNEQEAKLLQDVSDARANEIERIKSADSWITKNLNSVLALGVLGLSFILFGVLALVKVEPTQKDIIIYVLGALTTFVGQIIAYYFGSSKGSKDKTDSLNNLIK